MRSRTLLSLGVRAQATKPDKLVEHAVYEVPFDDIWCKTIMHRTMIVKGMSCNLYDVKVTILQKTVLETIEREVN